MSSIPKIARTASVGTGTPIGIIRAQVINILPTGSIIVKPLEANLRANTLIGLEPIKLKEINKGDILMVIQTSLGSYKFIAKVEIAPDSAVPHPLEVDQNEIVRPQVIASPVPAIPPVQIVTLSPIAIKPKAETKKTDPTLLASAADHALKGNKLKKQAIRHLMPELITEVENWMIKGKEMVTTFAAEVKIGWTQELVGQRSAIAEIAEIITKLHNRFGAKPESFNIPLIDRGVEIEKLPKDRNDIQHLATMQTEPNPSIPKQSIERDPTLPHPVEPPAKSVRPTIQPLTEEEQVKKLCNFSPLVWTSIKARRLITTSQFMTESLEEVRQLYARIDELLRGNNLDEALKEERKTYGTKPVKELYLEVFQEFAVKFNHYLNTKGFDPERLITNHYRKAPLNYLLEGCHYFDRDHLERGGLDFSEKDKVRDLAVWLKFLLTENNLVLEYPKLRNQPDELSKAITVFRKSLAVLEKYFKAG